MIHPDQSEHGWVEHRGPDDVIFLKLQQKGQVFKLSNISREGEILV
jgi:hypothetical protein